MELDNDETRLPEGVETSPFVALSSEEERVLVRESTSGFAGIWSIFYQGP
jgi:proteasome activator subunit 4